MIKYMIESAKVAFAIIWIMCGLFCCVSPFLMMAENKVPGIVLMCICPFWIASAKLYSDDIMKSITE